MAVKRLKNIIKRRIQMKRMALIVAFLLVSIMSVTPSFAKAKSIQFSLVLSDEEAKSMANKKYSYIAHEGQGSKNIFVSKEPLLTNADIESMIVIKKEDSQRKEYPVVDFVFTKEGSEKLAKITEKYLRKSIAIIAGDQILTTPYIVYPLTKGHLMISSWRIKTDDAAKNFVTESGFTPVFKGEVREKLVDKK